MLRHPEIGLGSSTLAGYFNGYEWFSLYCYSLHRPSPIQPSHELCCGAGSSKTVHRVSYRFAKLREAIMVLFQWPPWDLKGLHQGKKVLLPILQAGKMSPRKANESPKDMQQLSGRSQSRTQVSRPADLRSIYWSLGLPRLPEIISNDWNKQLSLQSLCSLWTLN